MTHATREAYQQIVEQMVRHPGLIPSGLDRRCVLSIIPATAPLLYKVKRHDGIGDTAHSWRMLMFGVREFYNEGASVSQTVKVLPQPTWLSSVICPPCRFTISLQMANPSPVPGTSLVHPASPR